MQIPSEDFLHFIWKTKSFDLSELHTTENEQVQILNFGTHNHDAGPDFSQAKIKIANQIWAGNVEMHIKASEWKNHKHDKNTLYDSVILHVVYEKDKEIYNTKGQRIPTIELINRIPQNILKKYYILQTKDNENWIPCQTLLPKVSDLRKTIFQERLLIERLQEKTSSAKIFYKQEKGDWYMVFLRLLLQSFGAKVNKEAFTMLGERLDKRLVLECSGDLNKLEGLLFGLSGFLSNGKDDYTKQLKDRYNFYKRKYNLQTLPLEVWKFSRMRPQNFPTVRLAQLCSFLVKNKNIVSEILDLDTETNYSQVFEVNVSQYWENHYRLDVLSSPSSKRIGKSSQEIICINCFAPFLFLYGELHDDTRYKEKAIQLLGNLKAEKNAITKKWEALGMVNKTAKDSQALIHLKNNYCSKLKCLHCEIAYVILKSE